MKKYGFFCVMTVLYIKPCVFFKNRSRTLMILSKATVQMSKYIRDDGQKQEWYDNESFYICCCCTEIGDEIKNECKRRNISHRYLPNVIEYRSTCSLSEACACPEYMCKIQILETGLKVRQLVDWAKTKFNDVKGYSVWIQPEREVLSVSGGYDDDGCPRVYAEHWRA